jgi:predicted signal transduction protein with EAL and GGDEF domain
MLALADPTDIRGEANRIARRLLKKLQLNVASPLGSIRVGSTIGIAICPADAAEPDELLALADQLMYVGKKGGRSRIVKVDELELDHPSPASNVKLWRQRGRFRRCYSITSDPIKLRQSP